MKIGVPREIFEGDTRVAITPPVATTLKRAGHELLVEAGAGVLASFTDAQYEEVGAAIVGEAAELFGSADVILKINPLQESERAGGHEAELVREGATVIAFHMPLDHPDVIKRLAERRVTTFSMEFVPRITRAQSMDALSSMATVAGYKAVLLAAARIGKFFPLLMTAAGTVPPANVLVLGAGVAGLQAIATAKRLGARVEAFDPRPAVKEQVKSLGAQFIEMQPPDDVEDAGGYAKEQSEAFLLQEQETIAARLPKVDVVITTAQVFGKRSPILITEEMVRKMRPGSLIVDLAVRSGGNCELSEGSQIIEKHGVTVYGAWNLSAEVPIDASQMYARNISQLFKHVFGGPDGGFDFEDEITRGACLTHGGEVVHPYLKKALGLQG